MINLDSILKSRDITLPKKVCLGMLFLTDDAFASAVTGVILPIDCGFAAYSGV